MKINKTLLIFGLLVFMGTGFAQTPGEDCMSAVDLATPSNTGQVVSTGDVSTCGLADGVFNGDDFCTNPWSGGLGGGWNTRPVGVYRVVVADTGVYSFTAATSGLAGSPVYLSLHEACAPTTANCIENSGNENTFSTELEPGEYFLFVTNRNDPVSCLLADCDCVDFNLTITVMPENDQCIKADPFCSGSTSTFPAGTSGTPSENGPDYGCLATQPNPAWYYLKVAEAGVIEMDLVPTPSNDIDFALWGPFTSVEDACVDQLTADCQSCPSNTSPNDYPYGNLVDCSYNPQAAEVATIPNAQVGEVYILLITNFSQQPTNVAVDQSNFGDQGAGLTDCSIVTSCDITVDAGEGGVICVGETYDITGSFDNYVGDISDVEYSWTVTPADAAAEVTGIETLTPTFSPSESYGGSVTFVLSVTDNAPTEGPCTVTSAVEINIGYLPTVVVVEEEICVGETASFYLSGAPNAQVTYTLNGGATETVTLDQDGVAQIDIPNATTDNTIEIIEASAGNGTCVTTPDVDDNVTATVTVDPNCGEEPECSDVVNVDVVPTTCAEDNGAISFDLFPEFDPAIHTAEWSHDTTITGSSASGLAPGTYTITITSSDNQCPVLTVEETIDSSVPSTVGEPSVVDHDPCLAGSGPNGQDIPFIVINEVMVAPTESGGGLPGDPVNQNSLYEEGNGEPNAEWIELYNPNLFDVDISCYILGANTGTNGNGADASGVGGEPNNGAIVFPAGTIIPAGGFITIGGNSSDVPDSTHFSLLDYAGNEFQFINNATRWFFRDVAGYVALYDDSFELIDATYYGNNSGILSTRPEFTNDLIIDHACSGTQDLGSALDGQALISYMGAPTSGSSLTFQRSFDGGPTWVEVASTPGASNGEPDELPCNGTITFEDNDNWSYIWPDGVAGVNQHQASGFCADTYDIIIEDENGCADTIEVTVGEMDTPEASFTANPTQGNAPLTVDFTNTSDGGESFIWSFDNGEVENVEDNSGQSTIYNEPGEYTVTLTLIEGNCVDTATVDVTVDEVLELSYDLPNIFTPNGDNVNDVFTINAVNAVSLEMVIVNRWGNVVFESNDVNAAWNGKVNNDGNDCSEGTYFYKFTITGEAGHEFNEHGPVQLVRMESSGGN